MLTCTEIQQIAENGEDSFHQFKATFTSIDKLAVEISAFANSDGGMILIGVADDGSLSGLERADGQRLNQWIAQAASQLIEPPIFVRTEILTCQQARILVIHVPRGPQKPYAFKKSEFWVKNGADKRRATREELLRLMQASHSLYADELSTGLPLSELDGEAFERFYRAYYEERLDDAGVTRDRVLENAKLAQNGSLTLAGLLLFGKAVALQTPQFGIRATCYEADERFRDKADIGGTLLEQFKQGVAFIERNLRRIQGEDDFNAPGVLELPLPVIKEVLANALVHRDYFISAPIFVHLYADRLEVVSPGVLPNTVTVENIKYGVHLERNPILLSFMAKMSDFAYTGRGSGIPRIVRICKNGHVPLDFYNERETNRFRVVIQRRTGKEQGIRLQDAGCRSKEKGARFQARQGRLRLAQ